VVLLRPFYAACLLCRNMCALACIAAGFHENNTPEIGKRRHESLRYQARLEEVAHVAMPYRADALAGSPPPPAPLPQTLATSSPPPSGESPPSSPPPSPPPPPTPIATPAPPTPSKSLHCSQMSERDVNCQVVQQLRVVQGADMKMFRMITSHNATHSW